MGFFSWECQACGKSIRHPGVTTAASRWMSQAVVLLPNGDKVSGTYDGYGRIGRHDMGENGMLERRPAFWHSACRKIVGNLDWTRESPSANDQGHFVGEYDPPEPKTQDDIDVIRITKPQE